MVRPTSDSWRIRKARGCCVYAWKACSPKSCLQLTLAPARGLRAWARLRSLHCTASLRSREGIQYTLAYRLRTTHSPMNQWTGAGGKQHLINLVACELVVWQNRSKARTRFGFLASCAVSACHLLLSRSSSHARDGGKCSNLRRERGDKPNSGEFPGLGWSEDLPELVHLACFGRAELRLGRWRAWGRHPRKEQRSQTRWLTAAICCNCQEEEVLNTLMDACTENPELLLWWCFCVFYFLFPDSSLFLWKQTQSTCVRCSPLPRWWCV